MPSDLKILNPNQKGFQYILANKYEHKLEMSGRELNQGEARHSFH